MGGVNPNNETAEYKDGYSQEKSSYAIPVPL